MVGGTVMNTCPSGAGSDTIVGASPHFARLERREMGVTPHVAQNTAGRSSAIDGRTTRHAGYAISQVIRKRIEEAFAWSKTIAGLGKPHHRGLPEVDWQLTFAMAAYNLNRLPKLPAQGVGP